MNNRACRIWKIQNSREHLGSSKGVCQRRRGKNDQTSGSGCLGSCFEQPQGVAWHSLPLGCSKWTMRSEGRHNWQIASMGFAWADLITAVALTILIWKQQPAEPSDLETDCKMDRAQTHGGRTLLLVGTPWHQKFSGSSATCHRMQMLGSKIHAWCCVKKKRERKGNVRLDRGE